MTSRSAFGTWTRARCFTNCRSRSAKTWLSPPTEASWPPWGCKQGMISASGILAPARNFRPLRIAAMDGIAASLSRPTARRWPWRAECVPSGCGTWKRARSCPCSLGTLDRYSRSRSPRTVQGWRPAAARTGRFAFGTWRRARRNMYSPMLSIPGSGALASPIADAP